jgi:outer membrane usher protein
MATARIPAFRYRDIAYFVCGLMLWDLAVVPALAADNWQEAVLQMTVNGQAPGETVIALRDAHGAIWLDTADFNTLRLNLPTAPAHVFRGERYFPLLALPGCAVQIDERTQSATVQVPAADLQSTHVAAVRPVTHLDSAAPGAFLNYQVSGQRIQGFDNAGFWNELGVFGPYGLLTDTAVTRWTDTLGTQTVRLDTTYRFDLVQRMETLTLGDAISNSGSWGDALRFGGVHWGTNFGIRPDLLTTPLLSANGSAAVPSTVDVLVNNQRVASQQLPPGPFTLDNLPPLSGAGDVTVVVRDALGREQTMTQPFYSGTSLLAPGLSDYSIDVGALRQNYTLESDDYGPLLAEQTYRRGLTDAITLEEHTEYLAHDAYAGGVNAALRTGSLGILTLTLAGGGGFGTSGTLTGIGFEHHANRLSFTASTQYASDGFHQVGDNELAVARFKQRTLAQAGIDMHRAGSLSLAYVLETFRGQPQEQTMSLTHSLVLGHYGSVSFTVSRSTGAYATTNAFLLYTLALGDRDAVSTTLTGGSGIGAPDDQASVTYASNPPIGPGNGYRVTAATSGDYDADWRTQLNASDFEVEAARNQGVSGERGQFEGAVTWLDGELHAARQVTGSFAVVDVAGIANLPVYMDNQLVTHTDEQGRALLPELRSYETNRIEVEPTELPLDTSIDTRVLTITPGYRSGLIVRFPVERVRAGTFRLLDEAGRALPAGAVVQLQDKQFPVGQDGMTYVTGYDHGMGATASWKGGQCHFRVPPPPDGDPLPDVGALTCHAGIRQ